MFIKSSFYPSDVPDVHHALIPHASRLRETRHASEKPINLRCESVARMISTFCSDSLIAYKKARKFFLIVYVNMTDVEF